MRHDPIHQRPHLGLCRYGSIEGRKAHVVELRRTRDAAGELCGQIDDEPHVFGKLAGIGATSKVDAGGDPDPSIARGRDGAYARPATTRRGRERAAPFAGATGCRRTACRRPSRRAGHSRGPPPRTRRPATGRATRADARAPSPRCLQHPEGSRQQRRQSRFALTPARLARRLRVRTCAADWGSSTRLCRVCATPGPAGSVNKRSVG